MDSHAQAPPEAWPEYLEPRYHEYLPSLHEENEAYTTVMGSLAHRVVGKSFLQAGEFGAAETIIRDLVDRIRVPS